MNSIACHMLVNEKTPKVWREQAVASIAAANVPCSFVPAVVGHLGQARVNGFNQAIHDYPNAKYLSWVDDDDPGAYIDIWENAARYLDTHPSCVSIYTQIEKVDKQGNKIEVTKKPLWNPVFQKAELTGVHHLHVMRKEAVLSCLEELKDWPACEEYVLMAMLTEYGDHHLLDQVGYRWRDYSESNGRSLITLGLIQKASRFADNYLIPALHANRKQPSLSAVP